MHYSTVMGENCSSMRILLHLTAKIHKFDESKFIKTMVQRIGRLRYELADSYWNRLTTRELAVFNRNRPESVEFGGNRPKSGLESAGIGRCEPITLRFRPIPTQLLPNCNKFSSIFPIIQHKILINSQRFHTIAWITLTPQRNGVKSYFAPASRGYNGYSRAKRILRLLLQKIINTPLSCQQFQNEKILKEKKNQNQ